MRMSLSLWRPDVELAACRSDEASARERWTHAMQENLERAQPLGGMPAHAQPFAGDPQGNAEEQAVV